MFLIFGWSKHRYSGGMMRNAYLLPVDKHKDNIKELHSQERLQPRMHRFAAEAAPT
jgi:hypothetical protein